MSERARALEQALRMLRNECHAIMAMSYDAIKDSAGYTNLKVWIARVEEADALLADPPPSGASPQAETSDDLSELWRQELYPHVEPDTFKRFLCDLTAEGWDDVRKEVFALQSIVDSRPAPVSPVEPEPPEELPCYCDIPSHILDLGCPRHQAPQCEPEPPKTWSLEIINRTGFTVEPEPCVWRDIDSAPKDGTEILVGSASLGPVVVKWKEGRSTMRDTDWMVSWDGDYLASEPYGWMPIPAPLKVER